MDTDCIIWHRYIDKKGYGRVKYLGKNDRAHRAVWMDAHGPIPAGMVVRHKCDNPSCVNLDHLEIGTQADNVRDMHERGRAADKSGELNGRAKLSEKDVIAIRKSAGTCRALGTKYGVSKTLISLIKRGEAWRHV